MTSSTETLAVDWPAWDIDADPAMLARYVVPAAVALHGPFRERGGEAARTELEHLWAALRGKRIGYAFEREPTGSEPGQVIRPPAEVLAAPRAGTCLDLALVLAGGAVLAGLAAAVIVLDPVELGHRHALVAVRLGEAWPGGEPVDGVWTELPDGFLAQTRARWDGPARAVAVLDPVGVATSLGTTRTAGIDVDLADAVAAGYRYLTDPAWRFKVGVAAGRADGYRPAVLPRVAPLREIYRKPETAESALRLLRPEYEVTPFQGRDELRVLQDFAERVETGRATGVAVIHGIGGAGKTRLALELADRMRRRGWYAGPLLDDLADPAAIPWLATLTAPLLVIVDYADARITETRQLLQSLAARATGPDAGPPAVVVLTARSTEGEWLEQILGALTSGGHPHLIDDTDLPAAHPHPGDIYRRTYAALLTQDLVTNAADAEAGPPVLPTPEPGTRWTTLDLVLHGWVAAQGRTELPRTRGGLYGEVLDHEQRYWARSYTRVTGQPSPDPDLLARAAGVLTLFSPLPEDAAERLRVVPPLHEDARWRHDVARALVACLRPGAGQGVTIRPDPVGDHHLLGVLDRGPELLIRALPADADPDAVGQALLVLTRAAQNQPDAAARHTRELLLAEPDRWRVLLAVASAVGGPALAVLESVVATGECALPLDEVSAAVPFEPAGLVRLGLLVDGRRLDATPPDDVERRADLLAGVSHRQSLAGDRAGALDSITEAVAIRRQLAQANPAAFLPNLAMSLNNLSVQQSAAGNRAGALDSITEAVTIRRQLAQANPAAFLPDLAGSLNNLSLRQSGAGDWAGALDSITEAVGHYRQLAQANPAAFLPDLAGSLNNLSNGQGGAGDWAGALDSITEAVGHYRQLARANPAAFLPDLAVSLNNLSNGQSDTGDRAGALDSITEAVGHYRQLARANPAAFRPNLAVSLNNLSLRQGDAGDRAGALDSITEAVGHYRQLAQANPAAFLPDLAMSLNNLAGRQSGAGDRAGALDSITEAVGHYRQLAQANPAAFLPDLAKSLNNLSNGQSDTGDRAGALDSITEAVGHYRQLAQANPAAFLPDLAVSLNNLSNGQSDTGDRAGALDSITEAVTIRRQLAQANPAAFLPDLAMSLNNLSLRQGAAGDRAGALDSITEAVTIRRQLAQANPAAFLPNLAKSLNNLSNGQSDTGDRAGALDSITEAVDHYRQLAQANPAAFLPDLAMSLNNLSIQQSGAGDRAGALDSITEAVAIRRQLAQANPAAFLPDLAMSLNNLSNRQSDTGDRAGALDSITEAVTIRRQLAQTNPAAFLPDLAMSLNNLSIQQSGAGDRAGALDSITEAVAIRRQLAQANPAAFLPDLAGSLNNLSVQQSAAGDRAGALDSITEAVAIRRQLAQADPAAFLPDLAGSLNNLSVQQSAAGDRAGALDSITEAVAIRRQLAQANPAAFLPDLAGSLNNLSDRLADEQPRSTTAAWLHSIDSMPDPAARAELRAGLALRLAALGQQTDADQHLSLAAQEADQPPNGAPGRILVPRARQAVREAAAAGRDLPDAPLWATAPLPEDHIALINTYGQTDDWPSAEALLQANRAMLLDPQFQRTLTALSGLHLDHPVVIPLAELVQDADTTNLDALLADRRADHDRRAVLDAWIATPTWPDSLTYLAEHTQTLHHPDTRQLLAAGDSEIAAQHLAILDLATDEPMQNVLDLITDPDTAEAAALDAIENADLTRLQTIAMASRALGEREITQALIATVFLVVDNRTDEAVALAGEIAANATDVQRRAHAIRLTALRRLRADLPALDDIIAILQPPPSQQATD